MDICVEVPHGLAVELPSGPAVPPLEQVGVSQGCMCAWAIIAALLAVADRCCLYMELRREIWWTYKMELYSATKKKIMHAISKKKIQLEIIIVREWSQNQEVR